jgi:hypothetical protein
VRRFPTRFRIPFGYHSESRGHLRGLIETKEIFMTLVSRTLSAGCTVVLAALIAMPAGAQGRRRAVAPPGPPGPAVVVTGTIKDATNGVIVSDAVLTSGDQTAKSNVNGQYTIKLPVGKVSNILIVHPAFNSFSTTVTAQSGGVYDFSLVEKASVTIKTKTNETHVVDIGTAQFSYTFGLGSGPSTDTANLCKDDGSDFAPDKTAFSRILGPATPATAAQCCQFGSVLSTNVEMKSGDKFLVYFKDSCSGNEVDFLGREKSTGRYVYFNFTNVSEIDFP